jgi:ATP-dependent Lon protease
MNYLDQKINEHFGGLVVRKDLVKAVRGNAVVPTYVLEYLLGQYCATTDEDSLISGIETVREIIRKHYVHRNEANLVKSTIREKGRHRVIDKVSVVLNEKADTYEAAFSNLGIKQVLIDSDTIKQHPKLLVSGVWCIADIEYQFTEDQRIIPWVLDTLNPIQMSRFDFDQYLEARLQFTLDEWIDLLIQSIGFDPTKFNLRTKLLQLARLIPYCERNFNIIELGPKGTGKSHIYSDFSPHGILISGGEVTVPKLFVNNSTGKIGLVGYWDTVAFDEFAGKKKSSNKALVDILKNYMANKTFSRGIETLGAEASMVFVGNTAHDVEYMLRHTNLFEELPAQFYDSAFLDRLHFYIPGWEVEVIRGEMFSDGYGFVVDYLAELLRKLRSYDFSQKYKDYFELSTDISTRDRDGINKTFSGLMKILFPSGEATKEEMAFILEFSIEGRKRVKDQLMRIDTTYPDVLFEYTNLADGKTETISTLEETQYPQHYHKKPGNPGGDIENQDDQHLREVLRPAFLSEEEKLIAKGEGAKLEFKSTLRWNIQSGRRDKAMEHSVLKTIVAFLNTEGGTLLVGVQDDGSILGIEPDKFQNEDKYLLHFANLINDKIGKHYVDNIQWDLKAIGDKKILRVNCKPSAKAVFLKDNAEEKFYVRSGPSTVLLSTSDVLEYSKKHFR